MKVGQMRRADRWDAEEETRCLHGLGPEPKPGWCGHREDGGEGNAEGQLDLNSLGAEKTQQVRHWYNLRFKRAVSWRCKVGSA